MNKERQYFEGNKNQKLKKLSLVFEQTSNFKGWTRIDTKFVHVLVKIKEGNRKWYSNSILFSYNAISIFHSSIIQFLKKNYENIWTIEWNFIFSLYLFHYVPNIFAGNWNFLNTNFVKNWRSFSFNRAVFIWQTPLHTGMFWYWCVVVHPRFVIL